MAVVGFMPLCWSDALLLSSGQQCPSTMLLMLLVARCCERPDGVTPTSPRISSISSCRPVYGGQDMRRPPSRRGDVEEGKLSDFCCCVLGLRQGSTEAALGSASTVAWLWLPSSMVEGRPLPPLSPVAASSGRRLKEINNLRASMPSRRPLCSGTASSRRSVPSGSVPGDMAVGCAVMRLHGGEGAGPDCVFGFRSRVLCAKSTVVDKGICHPRNFDFYMCAHAGMIGTTRPTHYNVLHDEIGFSPDDLQELVHNLSYVYQRSTTAISVVAPIYYVHLAAAQVAKFTRLDDMSETSSSHTTQAAAPPVPELPRLHAKVASSMFFC